MSDVNGKNSVCSAGWQCATVLSNKHGLCSVVSLPRSEMKDEHRLCEINVGLWQMSIFE